MTSNTDVTFSLYYFLLSKKKTYISRATFEILQFCVVSAKIELNVSNVFLGWSYLMKVGCQLPQENTGCQAMLYKVPNPII